MDKSLASGEFYAACEPTIDYATALDRAYARPPELLANVAANDATNANLDRCEPDTPRLTSIDELLKIEHWKPAEAQYCKAIADHYQMGKRSIQKWFVELLKLVQDIAPGIAEADLRDNDDRYSPLAVELLGQRYFAGSSKKWAIVLAEQYGDRLQALQSPSATAAPESPTIKPKAPAIHAEPEIAESIAIVVPQSHIHLLDDDQQSELALIHSLYVKPEPVKTFQSIDLNGDQETLLAGLKLLHSTISQMKSENDRIKSDTTQRKTTIEMTTEAIVALAEEGKKAIDENAELVAEAQAVQAVESDAKKRLAQLLKALGDI